MTVRGPIPKMSVTKNGEDFLWAIVISEWRSHIRERVISISSKNVIDEYILFAERTPHIISD